jgi:hypothetical protein
MTVMEVFTLLLVLFAGGTFMLSIITFVIKVIETRDKKKKVVILAMRKLG